MSRIFTGLAILVLAILAFNFYLGWTGGDFNAVSQEYRDSQQELLELKLRPGVQEKEIAAAEEGQTGIRSRLDALKSRSTIHVLFGILAALVTVMVNSICVTYFIGTGRWCKEVSETYGLTDEFVEKARKVKSRTFPWSILGIATILTIAAFGAAADPGTLRETTMKWVGPHFLMAIAGTLMIAYALFRQVLGIQKNQDVINEILEEVRRIREQRGLVVEPSGTAALADSNS